MTRIYWHLLRDTRDGMNLGLGTTGNSQTSGSEGKNDFMMKAKYRQQLTYLSQDIGAHMPLEW